MKICRFNDNRLGVVEADRVLDVTEALKAIPAPSYPWPPGDALVTHLLQVSARIGALRDTAASHALAEVSLLSPVGNPGKIIAAPVNYRKHLDEAREQAEIHFHQQVAQIENVGLFLKAGSSLAGPAEGVALQHLDRRNDHELELVVVIGKVGRNIDRAQSLGHVAGYAVGLDMTVRGPQERSMRKSIDTYSVLGPWLVTADEIPDPGALHMTLTVNGQPRQEAHTRDLLVDIPRLIEWASSYYTLYPGDLIYTGTPQGVGPVQPGDLIEAGIDGIGRMKVGVSAAQRKAS